MNYKLRSQIKGVTPAFLVKLYRRFTSERYLKSAQTAASVIGQVDGLWRRRISDVIAAPDNHKIPRCSSAGKLEGYTITMHNGVRVCANGYYGSGILNMLLENKGDHEPQEERAFAEIITLLPERCTMLELGA